MKTCVNCYGEIGARDEVASSLDGSPMHKDCANKCPNCGALLTDQQLMKNKCKCVVQPKSTIEMIRRSNIEDYIKCPHYFKLAVIEEVATEENIYAHHGIILHDLFDKYSYMDEISYEDVKKEFEDEFNQHKDKGTEIHDKLLEKGYDAIESFINFCKEVGKPFESEENIRFKIADDLPEISITFDRLDQDGDHLHMFDYKCGKTYTGTKLETDLQLPLYCEAVRQRYGRLPDSFTFLFVSEGKERRYYYDGNGAYVCVVRKREYRVDIEERLEYTRGILRQIKNEQFKGMCQNRWHCENMCAYYKNGKCNGNNNNGGWRL